MEEFITPMSVLDAVNIMLSALGEAPVNSLEGSRTADVAIALSILIETNREVQSEGWYINTEKDFPLVPGSDKRISVPFNALLVLPPERSGLTFAVRGGNLYNLKSHSFEFQQKVLVNIIFLLPFEDLTEKLRRYITIRAARVFQDRVLGSGQAHSFQEQDEHIARLKLVQENADLQQANIAAACSGGLFANYNVADTLRR